MSSAIYLGSILLEVLRIILRGMDRLNNVITPWRGYAGKSHRTQSLIVHRNRIELCYNAEQYSPQSTPVSRPLYSSVTSGTGVAGHVNVTNEPLPQQNNLYMPDVFAGQSSSSGAGPAMMTRPVHTHRPPQRYDNFISHALAV